MLSYQIDETVEFLEEFIGPWFRAIQSKKIGTDDFDESFKTFILKTYPEWLQKVEDRLTANGKKYFVSDQMTMADIAFLGKMYLSTLDDGFDYCHILQSVVQKFPKTWALVEQL